ncbi:MAG: hypothetical protein B0W54_01055 [Cellvibrio sp. 79]|nr:MAG: hypothetical protein B0W54_01055 [Cellvibrio sp. 79]
MKKVFWIPLVSFATAGSSVFPSFALAQAPQPDEGVRLLAGAQYQSDSNFSRTADAEEEQILRAALGIGYSKSISAQRIALRFSANQYRYEERDFLNENSWEGNASWRSQFSNSVSTLINYQREETPVDQLEFTGRDLVARENANAQLSLGGNRWLGIIVGAHQLQQRHSNEDRRYLNFKDQDVFAELRYRAATSSWASLRYREGERNYELFELLPKNLNFDYSQWEIETAWQLTPKTELSGLAGYFTREGESNNNEGALASMKLTWQASPKLATEITYSFSQPALGESTDAPNEIGSAVLMFRWQWSSKINVTAGGSYSKLEYPGADDLLPRIERNISVTPLAIEWLFSDSLRFRFSSQWMERHSPIFIRDYDGYILTGGLALAF